MKLLDAFRRTKSEIYIKNRYEELKFELDRINEEYQINTGYIAETIKQGEKVLKDETGTFDYTELQIRYRIDRKNTINRIKRIISLANKIHKFEEQHRKLKSTIDISELPVLLGACCYAPKLQSMKINEIIEMCGKQWCRDCELQKHTPKNRLINNRPIIRWKIFWRKIYNRFEWFIKECLKYYVPILLAFLAGLLLKNC